jgi:aminopeptidase-like protein
VEHAISNAWNIDAPHSGAVIYNLAAQLYPICRSIAGNGVRASLNILSQYVPLTVHELATGTRVFDWTIPREWNIRNAYVKDFSGRKVIDFQNSNLHVVNYSTPVHARLPLTELRKHLFTLPEQPDRIPYRTTYYTESWGFCMSHNRMLELADGEYEVVIDASLDEGHLTYGEFLHRGEREGEVLLSAHICHPSLANDNCSGLALLAYLARQLGKTRYSYRFLFAPGTIGAIAWLSRNEASVERIRAGLVLSCVGDGGDPTYKRSRRGDALIDRAMMHVLHHLSPRARILEFSPYGYDERQFCSPGFNLPIGMFQRSQFSTFPEYHTDADNLDLIRPEHLQLSCKLLLAVIDIIEKDGIYVNLNPRCEPQLGRRGLYQSIGGYKDAPAQQKAMLWVLNLSDGCHSLLDIAERSGLPFANIWGAAELLIGHGLLRETGQSAST